jgi:tetratricopeptide (TPR) repeat protein
LIKLRIALTCIGVFIFSVLLPQKSDSIIGLLSTHTTPDSTKVHLLYKAGFHKQQEGDYSVALDYLNDSKKLAKSLKLNKAEGLALTRIGFVYEDINEIDKARESFLKALSIYRQSNDLYYQGEVYNSLGNLEELVGNYNAALKYFFSYLECGEKLNNQRNIAIAYNNIAVVFADMNDFKKELAYNFKALKIREKLNDPPQLAASYNNIGICYQYVDNYDAAIPYFNKALALRQQVNDRAGVAAVYHNLAICYKYQGNFKLAEQYYLKALNIQEQLNSSVDIALTNINLGRFYMDQENYPKSFSYLKKALEISTEKKMVSNETDAHRALFEAYEAVKQTGPALFHFKKFIELRDSINSIEKSREFTRIEMQNKFDRESAINRENQAKKDAIAIQQQKQQRIVIISVTVLLLIISVFLVFVYRNYRQKQAANIIITNQKKEVEDQKQLVEEKQKEIIDSINYAQRIQSAILSREEDIKQHFPQSYLLYNPKDIVAGDFYFFETTATHVFYAAADCTGHGVPGALVSVVCSNALTRCVKEFGLDDPGSILNKTRELVLETFKKSGQDVKDGMDISLLVKEIKTGKLRWAGANNPLWYISVNPGEHIELTEITANKQPIGLSDAPVPFTTHDLPKKDQLHIFLFTDGYADQFGGPKGKKFKYKQLENLFISCFSKSIHEEKELLLKSFNDWKNGHEQVDDVLVIGLRI